MWGLCRHHAGAPTEDSEGVTLRSSDEFPAVHLEPQHSIYVTGPKASDLAED